MKTTRLRRQFVLLIVTALSIVATLALAPQATAFRDRNCSDFTTHHQAQKFFKKHHPRKDPHRLDADHDGKACESLPKI